MINANQVVPHDFWYQSSDALPYKSTWAIVIPAKNQPLVSDGWNDYWCFGKEPLFAYFDTKDHHGMQLSHWWAQSIRPRLMRGGKNGYAYCVIEQWQPLPKEIIDQLPLNLDDKLLMNGPYTPRADEVPELLAFMKKYSSGKTITRIPV